ncbi:MAG: isopeptide-forming domain-containing fimbrial protein [Oscillospiraceae bacterium]|nr:isopeptide-forming domain-containing fimbrial protein [Oscillospiraceae bacterium]
MKKLFAVLLAVAMLLSLGVTAFAADDTHGDITVLDTPENSAYYAIKVFDATQDQGHITYTIDGADTNKLFSLIFDKTTGETKAPFSGLKAVKADSGNIWTVEKLTGFDAAEFAKNLRAAIVDSTDKYIKAEYRTGTPMTTYAVGDNATIENLVPGYYLVVSAIDDDFTSADKTSFPSIANFMPAEDRLVLTTVLAGQEVNVQNKNDMPLDKQVDNGGADGKSGDGNHDDNNSGVAVGDILNYQITTKVPHTTAGVYESTFVLTDTMTEGLTFLDKIHIKIDGIDGDDDHLAKEIYVKYTPRQYTTADPDGVTAGNQAKLTYYTDGTYATTTNTPAFTLQLVTDSGAILKGDQIRFDTDGHTFELSLDVASADRKAYEGQTVTVDYSAQVNEAAVAVILQNTATLSYGEGNNITVKDAETDNYTSRIVIDKFETGNRSQKLPGAEFILYSATSGKGDPEVEAASSVKYYQLKAKAPVLAGSTPEKVTKDTDGNVKYADTAAKIAYAVFVTDSEGNTHLAYTDASLQPYYYDKTSLELTTTPGDGKILLTYGEPSVIWLTKNDVGDGYANATKVRTAADGSAQFAYLKDNDNGQSYYLKETKAPVDYTQLLNPVEVSVNGKDSLDKSLSAQQRADALTNIANVANTPGSTLPSTGGVGATLMTIGGVALILAAGAFLVLRRRKEQE